MKEFDVTTKIIHSLFLKTTLKTKLFDKLFWKEYREMRCEFQ